MYNISVICEFSLKCYLYLNSSIGDFNINIDIKSDYRVAEKFIFIHQLNLFLVLMVCIILVTNYCIVNFKEMVFFI